MSLRWGAEIGVSAFYTHAAPLGLGWVIGEHLSESRIDTDYTDSGTTIVVPYNLVCRKAKGRALDGRGDLAPTIGQDPNAASISRADSLG